MGLNHSQSLAAPNAGGVRTGVRTAARAAAVLAALLPLSLCATTSASAHESDGYSHDSTIGLTNTDWMSSLSSQASLSQLSLPGTHDSGASRFGGDSAWTQSMALPEQLRSGIRAWDIRLKRDSDGKLTVYHGIARQGQDFTSDVLATANDFLSAHSHEAIVMRVKDEAGSTSGFATAVKSALDRYSRVYTGASDNPLLGDIRGKIVVLQDFTSSTRLGIPWSRFAIQDDYNLSTNWQLASKWRAIKGQLDTAQNGPGSTKYINFLSGSGGSFPYFVASGHSSPGTGAPRLLTGMTRGVIDTCSGNSQCIPQFPSVNCFLGTCSVAFEGTDILTMDEIGSRTMPRRFGVVYADFPGKGLVRAVITANEFRDVLRGQSSGRCADVDGARHANGTVVQLYDCHGKDNQRWTATPAGELRIYDGTKCMDARDGGVVDGTRVQIHDCNGTGAQQWTLNPDGSVVNPRSGRCLDALGDGRTNGTPLALWSCHGGANQRWAMGPHS
jgi:1-phosphatidylinositol phosphodiesterase